LVLSVFAFYPVAGSIWLSLHSVVLSLPASGEPFVGLENYAQLASRPQLWRSLGTTAAFVAVSTLLELALGLLLALCLDAAYRGRGLVRAAVLVPWAVPTVVASQMWRFLLNDGYGPVAYYLFGGAALLADPGGAFAAIVVADVWKTSSFAALIILAGLQGIPGEVYEAAAIDGAGPLRRFVSVTLPLLKPALLAALLFRTIDAFRVFDLVFVMTQGGPGRRHQRAAALRLQADVRRRNDGLGGGDLDRAVRADVHSLARLHQAGGLAALAGGRTA
jgi:multiple sugar transport system permease protein